MALPAPDEPGAGLVTPPPLLDALDDPRREVAARAQAYLNVPLHRAFFDRHRDQTLPPDEDVQRELVADLGVSAGQEMNVRRVVLKAATQAGLLGEDRRLVLPPGLALSPDGTQVIEDAAAAEEAPALALAPAPYEPVSAPPSAPLRDEAIAPPHLPQAVAAWLRRMPPEGMPWPPERRARWHDAFRAMTDAIYNGG